MSNGEQPNQSNEANEPNRLGSETDNSSNSESNTSSNHVSSSGSTDRTIVSVTIPEGMSSHGLASYLKSVGLIQDDRKFDNYLIRQGLARVIRTGTFEVPTSANYDTLAEMLTYTDQRER